MSAGRVLVTGGCGFVGRHFTARLLQDGYDVTIVDDLSTGLPLDRWPSFLRDSIDSHPLTMVQSDIRDYCREKAPDFDIVFHLAAVVGGRQKIENDPLAVATDLAIDATLFNWITRRESGPKLLYFSSSAAYPIALQSRERNALLAETDIDFSDAIGVPDMTYGWSKLTGEFLARHAAERYGLDVAIYRPFSGYGEDQDLTYPFPSIIQRVVREETPIVVWGSGDQCRDFIHIDDVVEAVLVTMDRLAPAEAVNLGSGTPTTFRELAAVAAKIAGHNAQVVNDPTKPEGVFARVADIGHLSRHYCPKVPLEEGIERALLYQRSGGHAT